MSVVSDNSQEESNTPWGHFCCADNPFSGEKSFWKHQLFSLQSAHCCGEQLSLTFPEEGYKSVEVKAIPPGRVSSKATPHFSSSPRDTGTAWQCSFCQMPWQHCSLSLGQFGDPKLPFLVDWNPRREVNQGLDSTETI